MTISDKDKLQRIKELILLFYSKEGHEKCHYYPEIFKEIAGIIGIRSNNLANLPSLKEFQAGCLRYQEELFSNVKEK